MSKTTFYLIRHGEVKNLKQIIYGRLPGFPLTENGRKQVEKTALKLKKFPVGIIYSSPLLRARESAGIIAGHLNLKPKISYDLIEIKNIFEGTPLSEYKNKIQPHQFEDKYVKRGNESIEKIAERMMGFLVKINKMHNGKHIVVVSHGDPIAIIKSVLDKRKFTWEYKKNNYINTGDFVRVILE